MPVRYSKPLRGYQVYPNYCTNWQFAALQGITFTKPTTETSKTISDICPSLTKKHQINVNSIISMSLLATLNFTKLPPSLIFSIYLLVKFWLQELFWIKESSKFTVHIPHNQYNKDKPASLKEMAAANNFCTQSWQYIVYILLYSVF